MMKAKFDRYLEEQMEDPAFAAGFRQAGEAWDVALEIAALREQIGPSPLTGRQDELTQRDGYR